jgi:hypothetical protein
LAVARFFVVEDGLLVEARSAGPVSSFIMAIYWRCISAVQKPRAAPAHMFAALSHTLIQGFFIALLAQAKER